MKPHSVAMHPSPKLAAVAAWRSPQAAVLNIQGTVQDAHTACGNGITWALEVRRGHRQHRLASGVSDGDKVIAMGPFKGVQVAAGDVVALVIGPRDGNHSCDLTAVELELSDGASKWSLAGDVASDVLAGNPHADRLGHKAVWHFFGEPEVVDRAASFPAGSILARWLESSDSGVRRGLASELKALLQSESSTSNAADRLLRRQLLTFTGPLLAPTLRGFKADATEHTDLKVGLDPKLFGGSVQGAQVDSTDLCVDVPSLLEVRLPTALAAGAEVKVVGRLHRSAGEDDHVQMQVLDHKPNIAEGIAAGNAMTASVKGQWSDNNLRTNYTAPVIAKRDGVAWRRFEAMFDEVRQLFPPAVCYTRIVPVDEVVTLTLFHREDEHLKRLMLDEAQSAKLDRLWDELLFVSEAPLKQVDVFEQLYQFATQDASPAAFEPMREPIKQAAEAFKKRQIDVESLQVQAVLKFADRAWRRALTTGEQAALRALYAQLRQQPLPHTETVRMLLARVLVAPAFMYRGEKPVAGPKSAPVGDDELATRLSYFLWSSLPDDELRRVAASGTLHEPNMLAAQTKRMLKDAKVRRLATEFGCQWLHVRDLETLDEKSERHFPMFAGLRSSMQEETVRFFMDLLQNDHSVLSLLDADYTFVNGALAAYYGLPANGEEWQRVNGLKAKGRGGLLGFASTLAKQSGASRTSPILRGAWISEVVLGDKLPIPPKGVPVLPEEAPEGLTERKLTERHSRDPKCASCHQRIDPFGFALEGFDAIGHAREKDVAGLKIDSRATLPDGSIVEGLAGLRSYILEHRSDAFLRQFCRKLLGYALGRAVQFSDKPLIDTMVDQLRAHDFHSGVVVDLIVQSPQFREIRGRDFMTSN